MRNISAAALILTAMLPAANAGAMQNIKFGATLDINPLVSVEQSYDSNIYLVKNPKSAWINRTGLGADFVNKIGSRLDLTGGYTAEFLSYSRSSSINNATHQLANLGVNARLPKDVTAALKDDYMLTTDQASSELIARARRVQNTLGVEVNAPLRGKIGFDLDAQHTYHNYLSGSFDMLDRQEMLVGGDVSYQLQPKTKLLFGYHYGTMAYKLSANDFRLLSANKGDSNYNNLDLGVTGNLAPKVVGSIKAGVQFRNFAEHLSNTKSNITTGGYNIQLVWTPEKLTDVTVFGSRGNIETSYGNSRFYTATLADIKLERQVRKIKAGLGLNYETIALPEKTTGASSKRFDKNFGMRLTAEYDIQKWLKAGAEYAYKNRASNENSFEYHDNTVSVSLKGMF